MEDEIVKTKAGASAAHMAKMRDAAKIAKAAKVAKAAEQNATEAAKDIHRLAPTPLSRQHKQAEDMDDTPRGGSKLQSKNGRVEALGRDGEVLSRSQVYVTDSFEIEKRLWPKGWDYQWNTISVHGNADVARDQMNFMQSQGWRAVPAERYAGTLLPRAAKGSIVRGGVILEERPTSLGDEARAEDVRNARKLISDRNESLKLAGVKQAMPDGFEMGGKYKGTGGDIRMSIDKALDVPAPSYTLANPGDE